MPNSVCPRSRFSGTVVADLDESVQAVVDVPSPAEPIVEWCNKNGHKQIPDYETLYSAFLPYKTKRDGSMVSLPVYTSQTDWDKPIDGDDFLYRQQLSQLIRKRRNMKTTRVAVFDFDNTLFKSPLPNPKIWDQRLIGMLKSTDLGWFHDARTLSAPYLKYTNNHWIESTEKLVHLESGREDTLVVLLTGRSHAEYRDVILGLLDRRKCLKFDIIILKETPTCEWPLVPQDTLPASSPSQAPTLPEKSAAPFTFDYKMMVVEDIISAFKDITEVLMWDDRMYQCEKTQHYLDRLKERSQGHIDKAVVYHVPPQTISMNEKIEHGLVMDMVHEYNARVRKMGGGCDSTSNSSSENTADLPVGSLKLETHPSYTGVFLDNPSRYLLQSVVHCPRNWTRSSDHMTLNLGPANVQYLRDAFCTELGDSVEIIADAIGTIKNAVISVRISSIVTQKKNTVALIDPTDDEDESSPRTTPHITVGFNELDGARAVDSKGIQTWKPLRNGDLRLKGILRESHLTTAKIIQPEVKANEVSIGDIVCQIWPNLQKREIGVAVTKVKEHMALNGIENSERNRHTITEIVRFLY